MNRLSILLLVLMGLAPVQMAFAKDYLIAPGEPMPTPEGGLAPGDRILFAPGAYPPPILGAMRGTAENPIVLDSVDKTQPAMFIGGDYSLQLLNCDHIEVGTFAYISSNVGGIRILGSPEDPCTGIRLRSGYIAKPGRDQNARDGIFARWVEGLTIEGMKIDHWKLAAINIANARNVTIQNLTLTGNLDSQFGVLLGDNVAGCNIERTVVMYASAAGFQIGVDPIVEIPVFEETLIRWANSDLLIGGCVTINCPVPIAVGSVNNLLIDQCTLFKPVSCAVAFRNAQAPFAQSKAVTFQGNLITWEVGQLRNFLCSPQWTQDLSIGRNLWWSHEMPEGAAYLGPLPGDADKRQVYNVDPKLVERTLLPETEEAKTFGCAAYKAPKTSPQDPDTAKSEDNP